MVMSQKIFPSWIFNQVCNSHVIASGNNAVQSNFVNFRTGSVQALPNCSRNGDVFSLAETRIQIRRRRAVITGRMVPLVGDVCPISCSQWSPRVQLGNSSTPSTWVSIVLKEYVECFVAFWFPIPLGSVTDNFSRVLLVLLTCWCYRYCSWPPAHDSLPVNLCGRIGTNSRADPEQLVMSPLLPRFWIVHVHIVFCRSETWIELSMVWTRNNRYYFLGSCTPQIQAAKKQMLINPERGSLKDNI